MTLQETIEQQMHRLSEHFAPEGEDVEQVINVDSSERLASVAIGGLMTIWGLRRRTVPGLMSAILGSALVYRGISGHCACYEALGIDTAHRPAEPHDFFDHGIHVEQSVTVNKAPDELYRFWRNFENLPHFMKHLRSVQVIDDQRSHWVASAPAGRQVEWDARIINDEPDALIAWRSTEDAGVDNAGSVRFVEAPGGRGTEVKVVVDYIPPAGRLGALVARLFGENPEQQIREDLRRFKQMMEAGEIPSTKGQPRGACVRQG